MLHGTLWNISAFSCMSLALQVRFPELGLLAQKASRFSVNAYRGGTTLRIDLVPPSLRRLDELQRGEVAR